MHNSLQLLVFVVSLRATTSSVTARTTSVTATASVCLFVFSFIFFQERNVFTGLKPQSPITFVEHCSRYEQITPDHCLGLTSVVY